MMTIDLFEAIAAGRRPDVEAALAEDPARAAERDASGVSALMTALYHRKTEIAELLRAALPGLDVFEAAAVGDVERLREHASRTADRSPDGFTPLHLACFFGREEVVAWLIGEGAAVTEAARNPSAVHPLHSAASARAPAIVARLLEAGANPNARQHGGWTALHAAALHGDVEMARALIAHGADPSCRADDGSTAADLARKNGHEGVLGLLP